MALSYETSNKIHEWIKWLVWQLSQKYPQKLNETRLNEIDEWVFYIGTIVLHLEIIPDDVLTSSRSWNDLMFELGKIWVYIPIRLEHIYLSFWAELKVEQNQNLGKNILLARSVK